MPLQQRGPIPCYPSGAGPVRLPMRPLTARCRSVCLPTLKPRRCWLPLVTAAGSQPSAPIPSLPRLAKAQAQVSHTAETAPGSPHWHQQQQYRQQSESYATPTDQGRVGITDNQATSTSGRDNATSRQSQSSPSYTPRGPMANVAVASHTAIRPHAPPTPSPAVRYFTLGAIAAVALHYLVNFAGTLPVVQSLIKRFIWWTEPKVPALPPPDDNNAEGEQTLDGESVEWVNMCWRKAWRVYQRGLERWLADLLQPVFDNLVADGIVPSYVQRLRIADFTLDHEAPYFSNMRRRSSRKDSDLNGVVDVRYTGGARMLLLIECGTGNARWRVKVPVMVSDLDLECKMWLKIRLAPMCPYIGTLSLAFVGPPNIKVQLAPYNRVRLMRIPILQAFLTKLLTVDLPGLMTLPKRLEINIPPALTAVAEAAVGRDAVMRAVASAVLQADALEHALLAALPLGPQGAAGGVSLPDMFSGELQVTLHEARDLPVWGFPWQSNPYCRIVLSNQAVTSRRDNETSHASSHRAPVWNQEFQFLAEEPGTQKLEVWVYDSPITGRTDVGYATLNLRDLPTDGTLDIWLPIESSMPGERTQGAVHLSCTYKPFQDDTPDSGYREAAAFAALRQQEETITDIKSAADASSRANVAASAAAAAVAVTKAAAARAAARLARAKSLVGGAEGEVAGKKDNTSGNGNSSSNGGGASGKGRQLPSKTSASTPSSSPREQPGSPSGAVDADTVIEGAGSNGGTGPLEAGTAVFVDEDGLAINGGGHHANGSNGTGSIDLEQQMSLEADVQAIAAITQLQEMTATMRQLTQEVESINAGRTTSGPGQDREAATAAAVRAVAAAEALAASAVAAGDVGSANDALHAAAVALETTVAQLGVPAPVGQENSAVWTGAGWSSRGSSVPPPMTGSGSNGAGSGSNSRSVSGSSSGSTIDDVYSSHYGSGAGGREEAEAEDLTPQERAARAIARARAAAAAAAAAVEASEEGISSNAASIIAQAMQEDSPASTPTQLSALSSSSSLSMGHADQNGGGLEKDSDSDSDSLLAADAIPSRAFGGPTPQDTEDSQDEGPGEGSSESRPWWAKALDFIPGVPRPDNTAAETAADADGGAGGRASSGGSSGGPEPVGEIILGDDIPIEEIAIEVQKTWKARDRHVEALVQKALEARQREKKKPWVALLAIAATSSSVLLSIVLYRLIHMPH